MLELFLSVKFFVTIAIQHLVIKMRIIPPPHSDHKHAQHA